MVNPWTRLRWWFHPRLWSKPPQWRTHRKFTLIRSTCLIYVIYLSLLLVLWPNYMFWIPWVIVTVHVNFITNSHAACTTLPVSQGPWLQARDSQREIDVTPDWGGSPGLRVPQRDRAPRPGFLLGGVTPLVWHNFCPTAQWGSTQEFFWLVGLHLERLGSLEAVPKLWRESS
jgi:hypothetical protein